jgi:hypothetical protein
MAYRGRVGRAVVYFEVLLLTGEGTEEAMK